VRLLRAALLCSSLVCLALVSGCGARAATAPADSGVQGQTVVDGDCPVLRADSPCPDRPQPAKITVTRSGSPEVVTSVQTDEQGRFRVPLTPGNYVLHAVNTANAMLPRAPVTPVTVDPGSFRQVRIRFDSGIRGPIPGG
jgi:hypothetical protein